MITRIPFNAWRTSVFCLVALLSLPIQARILYVRTDASGLSDGTTWANAFKDLQPAIDLAEEGDSIFVAAGTYYPTLKVDGDSVRNMSFYIYKDIRIYGGFEGTDGSEGDFASRDVSAFETILSGNLGLFLDTWDNAFHVVVIRRVSDQMQLDGFTITEGTAFGGSGLELYGAGIFNDGQELRSDPVIANCRIKNNHASESGGGMMNYGAFSGRLNVTLINCSFLENHAAGGGAVSFLTDGSGNSLINMRDCQFRGNVALTAQGSAISGIAHSTMMSFVFINITFSGNQSPTSSTAEFFTTGTGRLFPSFINCTLADNQGGSIRVTDLAEHQSMVVVRNSILWANNGNHGLTFNGATADVTNSIMQFGFDGMGNTSLDPKFVDNPTDSIAPHIAGDFHLMPDSPAIDAGNNADVPSGIVVDADGLPRYVDHVTGNLGGAVDLGPYEVQGSATATKDILKLQGITCYPNPVSEKLLISRNDSHEFVVYEIITPDGKVVNRGEILPGQQYSECRVESLQTGIYYVSFSSGKAWYTTAFVRQ